MYYERVNTDVKDLDLIIVIEAKKPRDEAVDTQVKIKEVVVIVRNDKFVKSELPRALSNLEQESDYDSQHHNW